MCTWNLDSIKMDHPYYIIINTKKFTNILPYILPNLRELIATTGLVILLKIGFKSAICWPVWPWNLMAHLLYYVKLYASFQSHLWFEIGVTVWKCPIQVKIDNFLSHANLRFDRWPWKTRGHIFYTTLSFVHNFGEFKLELQSRTAKFGSKSVIFCPMWPWNMTDDLEIQ